MVAVVVVKLAALFVRSLELRMTGNVPLHLSSSAWWGLAVSSTKRQEFRGDASGVRVGAERIDETAHTQSYWIGVPVAPVAVRTGAAAPGRP